MVLFGTSLVHETGDLLRKYCDSVICFPHSGGTLEDISKSAKHSLASYSVKPSKIAFMCGGNDVMRKRGMDKITGDYKQLIKDVREICPSSQIFMIQLPLTRGFYYDSRLRELNSFIQSLANSSRFLHCVNPAPHDVRYFNWDSYSQVYLHMNRRGKSIFAERLMFEIDNVMTFQRAMLQNPP